jgi:thiol-disulfide isomerase/thioredoxin
MLTAMYSLLLALVLCVSQARLAIAESVAPAATVPSVATTSAAGTDTLPPEGKRAPRLKGSDWLNSKPLTRAELSGKVVLVEFWACACVNCRRTVPAMKRLHELFAPGKDVVIVGIHTPELPAERDRRAVQRAIDDFQLPYPVLLDNWMTNWDAFENQYWPALYIIDRRGIIRTLHIGELHEGTDAWRSVVSLIEALRREPA